MPELPDVEVFRRYLDSTALHQKIQRVKVLDADILGNASAQSLAARMKGRKLESTQRHGKYVFVDYGGKRVLVLHFGMTGYLAYYKDPGKEPQHVKVRWEFSSGFNLAYVCTRKLGMVDLAESVQDFCKEEGLGPDALADDFGLEEFRKVIAGRSGKIKPLLMNQGAIAGIGNIYSDEMLFQAGIHPEKSADELPDAVVRKLYRVMRRVLKKAIDARVDVSRMPRTWLLPHREEGEDCPRCEGKVKKIKVGGRSAYLCPECQKE